MSSAYTVAPAQSFRDLSTLDLEREALRDGRLPDAGVADEKDVVLLAPRQNLRDSRDLVFPSDEGVDSFVARLVVEVDRIGLQGVFRRPGGVGVDLGAAWLRALELIFVELRDAVRDERDQVEPRNPLLFHERDGVESRSANRATSTFAPVTSSLPLDFTWATARRMARCTPFAGVGAVELSVGSGSICSLK